MNDLKERFDHLEINPDPKVWDSINDTLRRRAVARRRVAIGASSAVVAAAAVFAFVTFNRVNTSPVSAAPAPNLRAPVIAMGLPAVSGMSRVRPGRPSRRFRTRRRSMPERRRS